MKAGSGRSENNPANSRAALTQLSAEFLLNSIELSLSPEMRRSIRQRQGRVIRILVLK